MGFSNMDVYPGGWVLYLVARPNSDADRGNERHVVSIVSRTVSYIAARRVSNRLYLLASSSEALQAISIAGGALGYRCGELPLAADLEGPNLIFGAFKISQ